MKKLSILLFAALLSACNNSGGGTPSEPVGAPTVDAGDDKSAASGSAVVLAGSGSDEGGPVTFQWSQDSGPVVVINNANTDMADFVAPNVSGTVELVFRLTGEDADGLQSSSTVTVTVSGANDAPTANAGSPQNANSGDTVTLDGSGSNDPDVNDSLTFSWSQNGADPVPVTLSSNSAQSPTFIAPNVRGSVTFNFTLTVTDESGETSSSVVTVTVTDANDAPTANAGPDQSANENETVNLDGTGTDPDVNDSVTFAWVQTDGPNAPLNDPSAEDPSFTAPNTSGTETLTFQLTVSDGNGGSDTDTVVISVTGTNAIPVANAGPDQTVAESTPVALNGSGTDGDGDTLSFAWTQVSGPTVSITNANTANASFTSPDLSANAIIVLRLAVSDGNATSTDDVSINVTATNSTPTAAATATPTNPTPGQTVALDGTGTDADADASLSFQWTQTAGPTVAIADSTAEDTSFVAPNVNGTVTLTFTFTVTDQTGANDTATVNVTLTDGNDSPTANAGPDQNVNENDTVNLDGTGADPDINDSVTFAWTQTAGPLVTLSDNTAEDPSFTAPNVASSTTLTFRLVVSDGNGGSAQDFVDIVVAGNNDAPTANAGPDQSAAENATVTLSGSGTDPDVGDTLSYSWQQTGGTGPNVTLTNANTQTPSFTTPDASADYTLIFTLTVTDSATAQATDTVTISVVANNSAPTAAGTATPNPATAGQTVTLDGTGTDPETGDTLSYQWTQTGGTSVTITNDTAEDASFVAPNVSSNETLTFDFTVTDSANVSDTAIVTVQITGVNDDPTANAGPDQNVNENDTVNLDGTGTDPDVNDTVTFAWTQTAGTPATLSDNTAEDPSFTAPNISGTETLTFQLTVSDGNGGSDTDTVDIVVTGANAAPTADAGVDQTVNENTVVNLVGAGTDDDLNDTLTYSWAQVSGPSVTINNDNAQNANFTAPDVVGTAIIVIRLTVSDGTASTTDDVQITVNGNNAAPTAAGTATPNPAGAGETVTLDGTGADADVNDNLSYQWTQTGGTTVSITNATSEDASFTAPNLSSNETLTFEFTVTDDASASDTATVTVQITGVNDDPTANAGPDQSVNEGDTVNLDGTGADPDVNDTVTYAWMQTAGPTVALSNNAAEDPSFTAPNVNADTTLTFKLTVSDGNGGTAEDFVDIVVSGNNEAPTANAGADQNVNENDTVTLAGSGSDPDFGDTITYQWTQDSGPTVTLNNDDTPTATFVAPDQTADYTLVFTLTVTDAAGLTGTDTITINVTAVNTAPVASGVGSPNPAAAGATVTLDGTVTDPDANDSFTYQWTQTGGYPVSLTNATSEDATFDAPNLSATETLTFTFTVTDAAGETDTATVTVQITGGNDDPVANAGPDQNVNEGDTVTLAGSGTDPDVDATLSYVWAQTGGTPAVTLSDNTAQNPTFEAPNVGSTTTLTFELTVSDGNGGSDTDTVDIVVAGVNDNPTADAGPDQTVPENTTVTLSGNGTDPDFGDTVSYAWARTGGDGPAVTLSDDSSQMPTFTAPDAAADYTLEFTLTVSDGNGGSATDIVVINVVANNAAPTANAGPDQANVAPNSIVNLDGTASTDPEAGVLTYEWVQTGGSETQSLDDNTSATPSFTATNETTATITVTFELTVTDDAGLTSTDTVDIQILPSKIAVTGNLTFDDVPIVTGQGNLDYAGTTVEPVRFVAVAILVDDGAGGFDAIDFGVSDENGDYSLKANINEDFIIVVDSCSHEPEGSNAEWLVCVQQETTSKDTYLFASPTQPGGSTAVTYDFYFEAKWNFTTSTYDKSEGRVFAILDTVYDAIEQVLDFDDSVVLPPLGINWNPTINDGGFYSPSDVEITLNGQENFDTHEFDESIILHEYAHYLQDQISRDDSIGGPHTFEQRQDLRLAFSEGFANAFASIIRNDSFYYQSFGNDQQGGFNDNLETSRADRGWFVEASINALMWDLFDDANDRGGDTMSFDFAVFANVLLSGSFLNSDFQTSIYTFLTELKAQNPTSAADIDILAADENIASVIDHQGSNETYDGGQVEVLPIYEELTVDGGAVNRCSTNTNGTLNKLGVNRFFYFENGPTVRDLRIKATSTTGNDPDVLVHYRNFFITLENSVGDEDFVERFFQNEVIIIEVFDKQNGRFDGGAPGVTNSCFDVEVTTS